MGATVGCSCKDAAAKNDMADTEAARALDEGSDEEEHCPLTEARFEAELAAKFASSRDSARTQTRHHTRGAISAGKCVLSDLGDDFVPFMSEKSDEQRERLRATLKDSFIFADLPENDLCTIAGALEEIRKDAGETVYHQGEVGDCLYVIESGELDAMKNGEVFRTYAHGEVFGELAVLYNCPRVATMVARGSCIFWRLDRDTFTSIVKASAQKKREKHGAFIDKVPLLETLEPCERSQIVDALQVHTYQAGDVIMKEGDLGELFYIIEEGEAYSTKVGASSVDYKAGDYFGEIALLRNQPRAASVTCRTKCEVLSIDAVTFGRLLDVDLLEHGMRRYGRGMTYKKKAQ